MAIPDIFSLSYNLPAGGESHNSIGLGGLSKQLGYSQGGAPANVLGYKQSTPPPSASPAIGHQDYLAEIKKITDELAAMRRQTLPPSIDFNAINSQARQQAEAAVNPLYQKRLNDFLAAQATKKQRQQEDFSKANTTIDEALANALQANDITGQRTTQDVGQNLDTLANQEQNFQQQEGQGFEGARAALESNVAQSGLTGSGLGTQQINQQTQQRNQQSAQVTQGINLQKQAQQTLKTRTFEDLARSGAQASKQAAKGKEQNQIDLNRFIEDLGTNEQATRQSLEAERLGSVIGQESAFGKIGFQNYLQALNPAQRAAAASAYGGLF